VVGVSEQSGMGMPGEAILSEVKAIGRKTS